MDDRDGVRLSVVMPVFNEAATIRAAVERVRAVPVPLAFVPGLFGIDGLRAALSQDHPRLNRVWKEARSVPERVAAFYWRRLWPLGLRLSRRALPQPLRHWLWTRWRDRSA